MPDSRLIGCPGCGATNRVPLEKLAQGLRAVCGRCKVPLPARSQPFDVTDATFASQVEASTLPVLVDMWAPWCGPCRSVAPILEELAGEMAGRVQFAKLNIDDNPVTASRFRIQSIPAMVVIKSGREVERIVGALPKTEISRRLERAIA